MILKENYYRATAASAVPPALKDNKVQSPGIFSTIFDDFIRISSVHGVARIFGRTSTKAERLLWSFGFISATIIFAYVTWNIGYIYQYKPLKTVISDLQRPIFHIPFPEVTICNRNRLNWQRYEEAKNKFLLPQHRFPLYENVFLEAVNAYDTLRFGKFFNFKNLSNVYPLQLLQDLNYVNMTLVVELMAWKCHEIFTSCSWVNRSYDCCELFSTRKSQQGLCLSFNGVESPEGKMNVETDPYYPRHTSGIGPSNGLVLSVQTRESQHSPLSDAFKAIVIMLVEPYVWSYLPYEVPANTHTMISLLAYQHFHDENTRIFSTQTRQCVFENELGSLFYKSLYKHRYMYENCLSECQQEYLMKFCNCTIDLFYPPGRYGACGLADLPCLYQHNEVLQNFEQAGEHEFVANHESGMNCPCFFNCKSLSYMVDVHIDYGRSAEVPLNPNSSEIKMSVFFIWDTYIVYKTTAVYTVLDLMASLGGLASLCIGCSLMSITELLYFLFVEVPKHALNLCRQRNKIKPKKKHLKAKKIIVREKFQN